MSAEGRSSSSNVRISARAPRVSWRSSSERLPALSGSFSQSAGQHLGDQAGREKGLGHRVVQVARQPAALPPHRQALGALVLMTDVFDRGRCLVGQGLEHNDVTFIKGIHTVAGGAEHTDHFILGFERDTQMNDRLRAWGWVEVQILRNVL